MVELTGHRHLTARQAGQVLTQVTGTPYFVGVVVAGLAVSTTLALGGMRAATYVQAFQFGMLVLGIWWSRLTARGAVAGMAVGLSSSAGVMGVSLVADVQHGLLALLLAEPALWSVPLAFATMVAVSLRSEAPGWAGDAMLRLHLDDPRPARAT